MYTPTYPEQTLPPGDRGETFREEGCACREEPPCVQEPSCVQEQPTCPKRGLHRLFSHMNWKEFLSGDLLLIAIAILLFFNDGGDDCEKDEDLWLLLLILFFLK